MTKRIIDNCSIGRNIAKTPMALSNNEEVNFLDVLLDNQAIKFEFEIVEFEDWEEVSFLFNDKVVASMVNGETQISKQITSQLNSTSERITSHPSYFLQLMACLVNQA